MKKKKLAFLTGIVAIAGAVILVYKKVKKKAAPKSEEIDDERPAYVSLVEKKDYASIEERR